jgi:hypothetical protein
MSDDLKLAEAQEQNSVLRAALEQLLVDVECNNPVESTTIEALERAGYTYDPLGQPWAYNASLVYQGEIEPHDKAMTEPEALGVALDRLWEDVSELVIRGSREEFEAAVVVSVRLQA